MIFAEKRGEYDFGCTKDAMVATNENGERIAVFVEGAKANKVCIAVDLPDSRGTRSYAVDFDWLLAHLRTLEPNTSLNGEGERDAWAVKCFGLYTSQLDQLGASVEDELAEMNGGARPVTFGEVLAIIG